jgi:hypothetical protein
MVGKERILVAHDGGTDRAALGTKKWRGKRGTCDWWWDRGFAVTRMRGCERGSSIAQLAMGGDGADVSGEERQRGMLRRRAVEAVGVWVCVAWCRACGWGTPSGMRRCSRETGSVRCVVLRAQRCGTVDYREGQGPAAPMCCCLSWGQVRARAEWQTRELAYGHKKERRGERAE